ncbi:MAG: hypothetical protein ACM3IH_03315 [Sphingobacteriales bacterium]
MSDEIQRSLGRIEGKLDGIKGHLDQHSESITSIDARLGRVEKKVYWFSGITAAMGAALGIFIKGHN